MYVLNLYTNVGYSVLWRILYLAGLLDLVMDSWDWNEWMNELVIIHFKLWNSLNNWEQHYQIKIPFMKN
jgi:hypothetical protein